MIPLSQSGVAQDCCYALSAGGDPNYCVSPQNLGVEFLGAKCVANKTGNFRGPRVHNLFGGRISGHQDERQMRVFFPRATELEQYLPIHRPHISILNN
jgi:hypothetical protein